MSEARKTVLLVVGVLAASVIFAVMFARHVELQKCLYSTADVVGTSVEHSNGVFSDSGPMYVARYRGKTQGDGDECVARVYISERQYDALTKGGG